MNSTPVLPARPRPRIRDQFPYVIRLVGYGGVAALIFLTGQTIGAGVADSISHEAGFMQGCDALTNPHFCRIAYRAYLLKPPASKSGALIPFPEAEAANAQGRQTLCGELRNGDNDAHLLYAAVDCTP